MWSLEGEWVHHTSIHGRFGSGSGAEKTISDGAVCMYYGRTTGKTCIGNPTDGGVCVYVGHLQPRLIILLAACTRTDHDLVIFFTVFATGAAVPDNVFIGTH